MSKVDYQNKVLPEKKKDSMHDGYRPIFFTFTFLIFKNEFLNMHACLSYIYIT